MKRSASRILTTHTGSLSRSPRLQELLWEREDHRDFDPDVFAAGVREGAPRWFQVLKARPLGLSFEGANPRHAHEWKVWEDVKLPDGKLLIPGVLDSTTNFIEHPELIAQRIANYANIVGRENVMAGSDCGFGTSAWGRKVEANIAWAKLAAMAEGARLASEELWQG